ncbi:formate/nitrite transporter family protein [Anaeromicropila herbilytica]|uniref:Transporter n=1 Tax=Anaeromicropila herbilytica TaxID=2785025 RepID=A0A7R7IDV5_9FIRM|nr:formate/nitrite transporter family protein [Anaeromicropila herbilytica]BCN31356.1 transporter [Anaeromicropila herbilytica]
MFREEMDMAVKAAEGKNNLLKNNPVGYFLASMLAGMYVGFGILLIFTIGGMLNGQPYVKVVMGASFGIALSLVVIAGAELFTGNNMVMTLGVLDKKVSLGQTIKLWVVCFIGNLVGSILLAVLFWKAGLAAGPVKDFIETATAAKMGLGAGELFIRGILCNILVCLAIWSGFRSKSESGKLIMIFWCLFAFITTGFEHSVANMTLLTIGLLTSSDAAISLSGYAHNLIYVTLGNMVGGILFVAVPYFVISKNKLK